MEKGLYAAPLGIDDQEEEALEIDIVNPDMVTLSDGSVEITLIPEKESEEESEFNENIAEILDDGEMLAGCIPRCSQKPQ